MVTINPSDLRQSLQVLQRRQLCIDIWYGFKRKNPALPTMTITLGLSDLAPLQKRIGHALGTMRVSIQMYWQRLQTSVKSLQSSNLPDFVSGLQGENFRRGTIAPCLSERIGVHNFWVFGTLHPHRPL